MRGGIRLLQFYWALPTPTIRGLSRHEEEEQQHEREQKGGPVWILHEFSGSRSGSEVDIRSSPLLHVGCVWDIPFESICVPRFAAETAFHSDRATTAASRVSHALARFVEESSTRTSARLGTVVSTGCMVAPSRSKPWHTGKDSLLNLPFGTIRVPSKRRPRGLGHDMRAGAIAVG